MIPVKKIYVFPPNEPLRLKACHQPGDKFLLSPSKHSWNAPVILSLTEQRRLVSTAGDFYGCEDELLMVDTSDRTGVGLFSLPKGHWSEAAGKPHDFETSCIEYQLAHPRSDAEREFQSRLHMVSDSVGKDILSTILSGISEAASWLFWDVGGTRFK